MKFTLSWLKQHLETNSDIETILKKLTNIGLEVESSYNPSEALNGFIAVKIISTKPHPDADRLQLCLIDTGTEEICRDDFDSNEEYNAYIQVIEDIGGTCK